MSKRNRRSPKADANRAAIRVLYGMGNTTREVAEKLRLSKSYVHKILRAEDESRSKSESLAGKYFKQTTHWRTCRMRARRLMEKHLGRKLDRKEHVHHINNDYTDNRIVNLTVLSDVEHGRLHRPTNPIPRNQRPERIKYLREYWLRRKAIRGAK